MSTASLIPNWLIDSKHLVLGMLFKSLDDPLESMYPDEPKPYPDSDIASVKISDLASALSASKDSKAKLELSKLLKGDLSRENQQGTTVKAGAMTYTLKNSDSKFEALLAPPSPGETSPARTWIQKRKSAYMLVGKSTISKAVFSEDGGSAKEGSVGMSVPGGQIAAGATGVPADPVNGAADATAEMSHREKNHYERGYSVDSEVVWEIKYRPIKMSFFKESEVKLGKSLAWEVKGTGRGEAELEGSSQVLEVSLGDEEIMVIEEDEDEDEDE